MQGVSERASGGQGTPRDEAFNHVQQRRDRKQMWRPEVAGGSVTLREATFIRRREGGSTPRQALGRHVPFEEDPSQLMLSRRGGRVTGRRTLRPSVLPWRPPPPIQMKINV